MGEDCKLCVFVYFLSKKQLKGCVFLLLLLYLQRKNVLRI